MEEAEEEDAALPWHTVAWKTMPDAVIAPLSAPGGGAVAVAGDGARAFGRAVRLEQGQVQVWH